MAKRERIVSALLLIFVSACSSPNTTVDLDGVLAERAYDVQRPNLNDIGITELTYKVNMPYPGRAITDEKMQLLKDRGWRQCAQFKGEWGHFGDRTVVPPELVHQYATSFAKESEYLVIVMRYQSPEPPKGVSDAVPSNSVQHVVVLHYDVSTPEARAELGEPYERCLQPLP